MTYLLRRTRRAVWIGENRNRESAVAEFGRTNEDTDGLSVFEVTSEDERRVVVAAIACERQHCDRVDVIEMERDAVERYGRVERTPDKGTTPVPAANRLHCSLDWDAAILRRVAEELFDARTMPREFPPAVVRSAVRSLDAATVVGQSAQAFVRQEQSKPPRPVR